MEKVDYEDRGLVILHSKNDISFMQGACEFRMSLIVDGDKEPIVEKYLVLKDLQDKSEKKLCINEAGMLQLFISLKNYYEKGVLRGG